MSKMDPLSIAGLIFTAAQVGLNAVKMAKKNKNRIYEYGGNDEEENKCNTFSINSEDSDESFQSGLVRSQSIKDQDHDVDVDLLFSDLFALNGGSRVWCRYSDGRSPLPLTPGLYSVEDDDELRKAMSPKEYAASSILCRQRIEDLVNGYPDFFQSMTRANSERRKPERTAAFVSVVEFLIIKNTDDNGYLDQNLVRDAVERINAAKFLGLLREEIREGAKTQTEEMFKQIKNYTDYTSDFEVIDVTACVYMVVYLAVVSNEIVKRKKMIENHLIKKIDEIIIELDEGDKKENILLLDKFEDSLLLIEKYQSLRKIKGRLYHDKKQVNLEIEGLKPQLVSNKSAEDRQVIFLPGLEYDSKLRIPSGLAVLSKIYTEAVLCKHLPFYKRKVRINLNDDIREDIFKRELNFAAIYLHKKYSAKLPRQSLTSLEDMIENLASIGQVSAKSLKSTIIEKLMNSEKVFTVKMIIDTFESMFVRVNPDMRPNDRAVVKRIYIVDPTLTTNVFEAIEAVIVYAKNDQVVSDVALRAIGEHNCYYKTLFDRYQPNMKRDLLDQCLKKRQTLIWKIQEKIKDCLIKSDPTNGDGEIIADSMERPTIMDQEPMPKIKKGSVEIKVVVEGKSSNYFLSQEDLDLIVAKKREAQKLPVEEVSLREKYAKVMKAYSIDEDAITGRFKVREKVADALQKCYEDREDLKPFDYKSAFIAMMGYEPATEYQTTKSQTGVYFVSVPDRAKDGRHDIVLMVSANGPIRMTGKVTEVKVKEHTAWIHVEEYNALQPVIHASKAHNNFREVIVGSSRLDQS